MLQAVPSFGNGVPRLLVTFSCWTFIVIQVPTGPNTLYLAETQQQLTSKTDDGLIDALQVNSASGIVYLWWNGDLYAAGSQPPGATFKPFIGIPGVTSSSGGVAVTGQGGYGTGPSVDPASGGLYI